MIEDKFTELFEKLSTLQWLLQRHHLQNHAEHGPMADPTRGQGRVLAMLKMQSEISTKDLSYLLGIRIQSLNELLNKLEKGGYITRTPSEADRRVMLVQLTEKGKSEHQPRTDFGDIFNCLSEEEQTIFGKYLDRIITALEAQLGDDENDERFAWMRSARERMGDERFEMMFHRCGRHAFDHMEHLYDHHNGRSVDRPRHRHLEQGHNGPRANRRGSDFCDRRTDDRPTPPSSDSHDVDE